MTREPEPQTKAFFHDSFVSTGEMCHLTDLCKVSMPRRLYERRATGQQQRLIRVRALERPPARVEGEEQHAHTVYMDSLGHGLSTDTECDGQDGLQSGDKEFFS